MSIKNRKLNPRHFFKAEELDDDAGGGSDAGSDDGGGNETPWGDTWRETYAGEDEGKLNALSRYATPNAAFDGLIATKAMISSGEYKKVAEFPTEGTDAEKATWREGNNVPISFDKYDMTFEDGLVIGDDDKPVVDSFLEFAHGKNMSSSDVKNALEWHYQNEETLNAEIAENDATVKEATEDALRAEWGGDYRANINRINGMLDTAPEGVKDNILAARYLDGTPLASDQGAMKWLIDMALQINPATTLVPGAGDNIMDAVVDEIAQIKKLMANPKSEYYKGDGADAMQKRYRQLIEARDKSV